VNAQLGVSGSADGLKPVAGGVMIEDPVAPASEDQEEDE
jgi:hypothetical protein